MIINCQLKDILHELSGDIISCDAAESIVLGRIAALDQAEGNDLAIVLDRGENSIFDPISLEVVKKSKAGLLLAQAPVVEGKKYLIVADVLDAFTRIVQASQKKMAQQIGKDYIHESAIVHPSAVLGSGITIKQGSIIGAGVVLGNDVKIGENVMLHPGVKILDRCVVGDYSIIHSGAVIGSDGFGYQISKSGFKKVPQIGVVRIGRCVEIGANCTIDRAAFDETVLGDGVKLDNGVHIAHNVKIGPHTAILAQTGIAGSTTIGFGCMIGGQVAIKDNLMIGNRVKIVSKAAVMHNLKDGVTVAGQPAMPFGQWKRMSVSLIRIPDYIKMLKNIKIIYDKREQRGGSWWKRFFS